MSDQTPGGAENPDEYPSKFAEEFGDDDPGRSPWPILIAGGIVVTLVAIVLAIAFISSPSDRLSDSAQVQHVVNDAYTAKNSLNYGQFRGAYCTAVLEQADFPTEEQFIAENRRLRDEQGPITIPEMDVTMQGDSAAVTVHWNREKTADQPQITDLTVVRVNDGWKVCTL